METRPIKRILVPIDFSSCSRSALEYAAWIAELFDASVDVLHVWEGLRAVEMREFADPHASQLSRFAHCEAGHEMESYLALLEQRGLMDCHGRLEAGPPAATILDVAKLDHYDLVVMGIHGRGRHRFFAGSVAETVVRCATCPVLTVHSGSYAPSVRPEEVSAVTGRAGGAERT
jgi:nucleotide-binding universal stress UspA family protein